MGEEVNKEWSRRGGEEDKLGRCLLNNDETSPELPIFLAVFISVLCTEVSAESISKQAVKS